MAVNVLPDGCLRKKWRSNAFLVGCAGVEPAYLGYEPRVLTVEQTALMALPVRLERTTL